MMEFFELFATLLVLLVLYFIPTIVAASRKHPQTTTIVVINLFLGWTGIGWVLCLAWSVWNKQVSQ